MSDRRTEDRSRQGMLSLFRCAGARPGHEVYFSTPITTGELFIQWRRNTRDHLGNDHPDYPILHREHVVDRNLERVPSVVERLRRHYPDRLVIDPTGLDDIDGWDQSDYHDFWCAVVGTYVAEVVFADGWHFSTGCVAEFATAVEAGLQLWREDLSPLAADQGIQLVRQAVAEMEDVGEDSSESRRWLGLAVHSVSKNGASG